MLDLIAAFNPIERLTGLAHSVRRAPGLRGQHGGRLVGVRQISWPRDCGFAPVEIEQYLKKYAITVSNRNATDKEIMCDVSAARYEHATYLVNELLAGKTHTAWADGGPVKAPEPQAQKPASVIGKLRRELW